MRRATLLAYTDFSLILITPFCFFLHLHQYSIWRPEIGILFFSFLLIALLVTGIWLQLREIARVCVLTIALTLSLSFLPISHSSNALLAGSLLLAVILIGLRQKLLEILFILFSTLCLGIIFLPVATQLNKPKEKVWINRASNPALYPIIHVILDEFIGINGIPEPLTEMRQTLKAFYLSHGFRLYPNAYSHYVHTVDSIPNEFNFSAQAQSYTYLQGKRPPFILAQNHYFNYLSKKGYVIHVYQGDFIDYCQTKGIRLASCFTYPVTSVKLLQDQSIPITQKLIFIAKSYLISSILYRDFVTAYQDSKAWLLQHYSLHIPDWPWGQARVSSLMLLPTMAKLREDIKSNPLYGHAYFVHLLAPHSPYLYHANCQIEPDVTKWYLNVGLSPEINRNETRMQRYAAYHQQVLCVQNQLQALFNDLKRIGAYEHVIIVIQGDHGSRITQHDPTIRNRAILTEQDWRDCFPALYAIKASGLTPGIDRQILSLDVLQAKALYWMTGMKFNAPISHPYIYLLPAIGQKTMQRLDKARDNAWI